MALKKEETASFVIRFTQKIFQNNDGEPQVQWRGNIRHVQGGEEKRFSEFEKVVEFIQSKLADLTIQAIEDKSPEEQKGILSKSFELWKKMAMDAPKIVMDTIKDPKKQIAQFQDQIQDQISQVKEEIDQKKEEISQKLEIDSWLASSRSDYKNMMNLMQQMADQIQVLNEKVDHLTTKPKPKSKPK